MPALPTAVRRALAPCAALILTVSADARADGAPEPLPDEVVVTAERMTAPLTVVTDPSKPRQPLPAHDGADYLKAVPGFAVIRKGGTSGDPVFRGMAASRVAMSVDGEQLLGGCGMRMDPPTAYVFPETFERIVVIKGPQTVLHGPGNSAAVVSFERRPPDADERGLSARGSTLVGSFGRRDLVGRARFTSERGYAEANGTYAESGDYSDGDGVRVHSRYRRWTGGATLGYVPDAHTRVELTGAWSDGEAAYADRAMDGVKFERSNAGLHVERRELGRHVAKLDAQAYWNYVDHVMDNHSLRAFTPSAAMPGPSASNPDRRTTGGRIAADLEVGERFTATVGADLQRNRHTIRGTANQDAMRYEQMPRVEDARFRNAGLYGEGTYRVTAATSLIGGLRVDDWYAQDARATLAPGPMGRGALPNPTAGQRRDATLVSGFVRGERARPAAPVTVYAGLGHVERFPDYWEMFATGRESTGSPSAFGTRPERTTQVDAGAVYATGRMAFSLSLFASAVDDYVLIQSDYPKGPRRVSVARNVDARTWGGEADARVGVRPGLAFTGSLAYTRGRNVTDALPLGQLPPFEARLGVEWQRGAWSAGALARGVAAQRRVAPLQGNVVGQDLGPSGGFAVLSISGGWSPAPALQVTAGIDNVADRTYAEHLSRGGAMVAGFERTLRVNEPGRVGWLKVNGRF